MRNVCIVFCSTDIDPFEFDRITTKIENGIDYEFDSIYSYCSKPTSVQFVDAYRYVNMHKLKSFDDIIIFIDLSKDFWNHNTTLNIRNIIRLTDTNTVVMKKDRSFIATQKRNMFHILDQNLGKIKIRINPKYV